MHFSLIAQNDSVFVKNDSAFGQTNAGKIFLSHDLGDSWTRSDNGLPTNAIINALALADNIVVAATEEQGVYISEDGLKSWHASNKGLPKRSRISSLIYHHGLLFAGTNREGVFISSDKGRTWKSTGAIKNESIFCFYSSGNDLLVGAEQGIYRSDDNGNSWNQVSQGNQINSFSSKGSVLYAATSHGILRSKNSVDWETVWNKATVISIAQNDHEMIAMSSGPVYLAADVEGKNWVSLYPSFDRYTFRLTPSSDRLFIAPWKKNLRALNKNEYFHGRGLPEKVALSHLLETPYGLIVAIGFTGC
jgi:photosystem II stability/assembly factor-like uncharacterized protein